VVLIHAGTNEIRNAPNTFNPALTTNIIGSLAGTIAQIRTYNPDVKIFLASIIPFDDGGYDTTAYQEQIQNLDSAIPGLASLLSTSQSPVIYVDQYDGFNDATMTYDGVHPNAAGETVVSENFFNAMAPVLLPEPATWGVGAVGLVVLMGRRVRSVRA
jgi:lysophospholipase L1-like esterase